ncbi:hypothetical protein JXM67_12685 [candidate division WOR-3 bacterium]|nr:hypothetical protein [candidate division WOR-3 bacterium]
MARVRNLIARMLGRFGDSIFSTLSRWEERGRSPGLTRFLKLSLLGTLVTLITSVSAQGIEPEVTCYRVAFVPDIVLSDVSIEPNPTEGADTVTVKGTARMESVGYHITGGNVRLIQDTTNKVLCPSDGEFSDTIENFSARLYVGGIEAGTTWVWIQIDPNIGEETVTSVPFLVSEPEEQE